MRVCVLFMLIGALSFGAWADDVADLAERLVQARQGELVGVESPWLEVWELPADVRRDFSPPVFQMRFSGTDPYVVVGGRTYRPGDEVGGYVLMFIESSGVVLEVDGYPVHLE